MRTCKCLWPSTIVSRFLLHLLLVYKYSKIYIFIYIYISSYRESSKTPQNSKWNCVGANRPQHMHMDSHIVCVCTLNTPKIRILQKWFPGRRKSNSNLLINSQNPPKNGRIYFRAHGNSNSLQLAHNSNWRIPRASPAVHALTEEHMSGRVQMPYTKGSTPSMSHLKFSFRSRQKNTHMNNLWWRRSKSQNCWRVGHTIDRPISSAPHSKLTLTRACQCTTAFPRARRHFWHSGRSRARRMMGRSRWNVRCPLSTSHGPCAHTGCRWTTRP